jgi:hypothetical protein
MKNLVKNLDEKYFVPFPSFFKDKEYGTEVYLGPVFSYKGFPRVVNIIFTASDDLEEIKKILKEDFENTQNLPLSDHVKLAYRKQYEKTHYGEPSKPTFRLKFEKGQEGFDFSEEDVTLTVYVDFEELPSTEKIFFFASDL